MYLEAERGGEVKRFTVDAGECVARNAIAPRTLSSVNSCQYAAAAPLAERGRGEERGGLRPGARRHGEDAELAGVEVTALGVVGRRADDVRVVRDHDQDRAVDVLAVGVGELQVERL